MASQPSNNPWKSDLLELLRNVVRFALWLAFVINVLMFAVFSVVWVGHFLYHLWTWFRRTWFTGEW